MSAYFSTLEQKFCISMWPCNILYMLHPRDRDILWILWCYRFQQFDTYSRSSFSLNICSFNARILSSIFFVSTSSCWAVLLLSCLTALCWSKNISHDGNSNNVTSKPGFRFWNPDFLFCNQMLNLKRGFTSENSVLKMDCVILLSFFIIWLECKKGFAKLFSWNSLLFFC